MTTLVNSVEVARRLGWLRRVAVVLVDNAGTAQTLDRVARELCGTAHIDYLSLRGHGNIGYGRGHNHAVFTAGLPRHDYHLVLNPDVVIAEDALCKGIEYLDQHSEVALLAPVVREREGRIAFLSRRYPSLRALLARGFEPLRASKLLESELERYEARYLAIASDPTDIELASGCFMLMRTKAFEQVRGFDERYFLYFEDYDLSLAMQNVGKVRLLPSMKIQHHGGGVAAKGAHHIKLFSRSAFRFFQKNGWKF